MGLRWLSEMNSFVGAVKRYGERLPCAMIWVLLSKYFGAFGVGMACNTEILGIMEDSAQEWSEGAKAASLANYNM